MSYADAIFNALEDKFGYNKAERLEGKYSEYITRAIKEYSDIGKGPMWVAIDVLHEISRLEN